MTVLVSTFFAPCAPKRPANFIVLKYFLLGLLISNSIESILIIPKILDVLDQSALQARELEEMDIKRTELKELVSEKEKEAQELENEKQRELNVLLKQKASQSQHRNEEDESEEEEEEHRGQVHHGGGKGRGGAHHSSSKSLNKSHGKKGHNKSDHPEVRKRPQRLETGNNLVAVFMLFYGSATLCLGIPAIFKESVRLLRVLMYLSCLGTLTLVSAKFSLLMLMSVVKDMAIAALTFQYVQMIVASSPPVDSSSTATGGPAAGVPAGGTLPPQAAVNPFPTAATTANVTLDYSQPATQYNPTGQPASGW